MTGVNVPMPSTGHGSEVLCAGLQPLRSRGHCAAHGHRRHVAGQRATTGQSTTTLCPAEVHASACRVSWPRLWFLHVVLYR